ncbi:MAG: PQQ-binding-like beta-propeller repeat protein [Myxococcota bacterium]
MWRYALKPLVVLAGAAATAAACGPTAGLRPMVEPGAVVASGWPQEIHLINAAHGTVHRRVAVGVDIERPLVVGETLLGIDGDEIVGFRLDDGTETFRFESGGGAFLSPVLAQGTRVMGLSLAGGGQDFDRVVAFDTRTGKRAWSRPLKANGASSDAGRQLQLGAGLLVAATTHTVAGIDPYGGNLRWSRAFAAEVISVAVVANGVAVLTDDGRVVHLHAVDNRVQWSVALADVEADNGWDAPALAAAGERLLFRQNGRLVALDGQTGQVAWRGPGPVTAFTVGVDVALVRFGDDALGTVDVASGGLRWRRDDLDVDASEPIVSEPAGVVVFQESSSTLYAVELSDGRLRFEVDLSEGEAVLDLASR